MEEFEHEITDLSLTPSRGGVFEVTVDDELVFSKKQVGRHGEPEEILKAVRATR